METITRIFTRPGVYPISIDPAPGRVNRVSAEIICGGAGGGGLHSFKGGTGGGGGSCNRVVHNFIITRTGILNLARNRGAIDPRLSADLAGYIVYVGKGGKGGTESEDAEVGTASSFSVGNIVESTVTNIICQADGGDAPLGGRAILCIPEDSAQKGGDGNPSTALTGTPTFLTEGGINIASVPCSGGAGGGASPDQEGLDAGVPESPTVKWPGGGWYNQNGLRRTRDDRGLGEGGLKVDATSTGYNTQGLRGCGGGGGRGGLPYLTMKPPVTEVMGLTVASRLRLLSMLLRQ